MKILAGNTLKNLRKQHRFSQIQLANFLMISRPTYERYERDIVEIPLSKLCAIAKLYQIEPTELIISLLKSKIALHRTNNGKNIALT